MYRGRGEQSTIEGLPTFGSHVGKSAWGKDLRTDLAVDATGALVTIDEEAVLRQGADWLVRVGSSRLLRLLEEVPAVVRDQWLSQQFEAVLLSDRRFVLTERVQVTTDPTQALRSLEVTIEAINGGRIATGGPQ